MSDAREAEYEICKKRGHGAGQSITQGRITWTQCGVYYHFEEPRLVEGLLPWEDTDE